MRSPEARAGFTLVEVLAALVVTAGFVAVVLPFAGRLATRWWVGEARVEAADGWMQGVARLSDDLSQAVPIMVRQGDKAVASFDAGPDFVQFVRPALGSAALGLETVRFEVRWSAAGSALVRRAARFRPGDPSAPGSPTTILEGPYGSASGPTARTSYRAPPGTTRPRCRRASNSPSSHAAAPRPRRGRSCCRSSARGSSTKPVSITGGSQP